MMRSFQHIVDSHDPRTRIKPNSRNPQPRHVKAYADIYNPSTLTPEIVTGYLPDQNTAHEVVDRYYRASYVKIKNDPSNRANISYPYPKASTPREQLVFMVDALSEIRKETPDYNWLSTIINGADSRRLVLLDSLGQSLLHHAVLRPDLRAAALIIKANPATLRVTTANTDILPIHQAVSSGHWELTKLILALDSYDTYRNPMNLKLPIHSAILERRDNIAKLLLTHDVNRCRERVEALQASCTTQTLPSLMQMPYQGKTAFHMACMRSADLVTWMLKTFPCELTIDMVDNLRNGYLHYAAIGGDIPAMKVLIAHLGLKEEVIRALCVTNNSGCTPLYVACSSGNLAMVNFIIDQFPGATKNNRAISLTNPLTINPAYLPATKSTYPFHIACQQHHYDVACRLLQICPDACELFRTDGMLGINLAVKDSQLPLDEDLMRLLIHKNPKSVNIRDNTAGSKTPLEAVAIIAYPESSSVNKNHKARPGRPFAKANCQRLMLQCAVSLYPTGTWNKTLRDMNWSWRKQAMLVAVKPEHDDSMFRSNIFRAMYLSNMDTFRCIVSFI